MFFEQQHSFNSEEFTASYGRNLSFPIHIHRSFEFYLQSNGTTVVIIDEKEYILSAGEAVLVFPYQCHSYRSLENSEHFMCIFSPNLVPDYYKETTRIPSNNMFSYSWNQETTIDNIFLCRSLAYGICGEFEKGRKYVERRGQHFSEVLTSILLYANENFRGKCLLRDATATVGYDYAYISKLFKRSVGMTFNQYVNLLRIQKSHTLLCSTRKNITEIAYECGFSSLRAYNRKFLEVSGITPSHYRNNVQ